MQNFHVRASLALLFLAASALLSAAEAKRIALVVGNDAYQALTPLQKAVNDARAVKGALEDLGFTVIAGENLTRREMNQRLADLETTIEPGDQVFVFYAGHGVAIGSENYLLPVDMPLPQGGQEGLVRNEGHAADAIIRTIQGKGAATTFVVLDACRNNPISDRGTRNVGLDRGLARMETPSGVFVLFSAGIGQTALDRLNETEGEPNSVFTRKLVPLLRKPGLSHVDLAKELQQEVSQLAATVKHRQEPAYYDQIIGRVVLKEGAAAPSGPAAAAPPDDSELLRAELDRNRRELDRLKDIANAGQRERDEIERLRAEQERLARENERLRSRPAPAPPPARPELGLEANLNPSGPPETRPAPPASSHAPRPRASRERCGSRGGLTVCGSSVRGGQFGNTYGPANVLDGNRATAWVEGVGGQGVGEWIVLEFNDLVSVSAIEVSNGYGKNDDIFSKNSRVRDAELVFSGGQRVRIELADHAGRQTIRLSRPIEARWMQLRIQSVYPGWKYDETAISEICVR